MSFVVELSWVLFFGICGLSSFVSHCTRTFLGLTRTPLVEPLEDDAGLVLPAGLRPDVGAPGGTVADPTGVVRELAAAVTTEGFGWNKREKEIIVCREKKGGWTALV